MKVRNIMKRNYRNKYTRKGLLAVMVAGMLLTGCGVQVPTSESVEESTIEYTDTPDASEEETAEVAESTADSLSESTEASEESTEPFVPENPDKLQLQDGQTELPLEDRLSVFGQGVGELQDNGALFFGDGATNKCMFPLPGELKSGGTVKVTMKGTFGSDKDSAVRVYLTNAEFANCTEEIYVCSYTDEKGFVVTFELKANQDTEGIMLASSGYDTYFQGFTLTQLIIGGDIKVTEAKPAVDEEISQADWYQTMLEKAQLSSGNNYRLKKVIEKAQRGETVTIASIGGSITEGAGASRYKECYAYQTFEKFKAAYGAEDGSNVHFVNAGVGGTPSPFGLMRYQRDIVERTQDEDNLPDIVMVEYAVNDGGEPTNHGCYESLVKGILEQENAPAVILVFAVFPSGYTMQNELQKVGETYDLMMISTKDGPFAYVGSQWTSKEFFADIYHPTSLGHGVMADCIFHGIEKAAEAEEASQDIELDVKPAYNTDYRGLKTIFADDYPEEISLDKGSFSQKDSGAYKNIPIGAVYADNFHHHKGSEPLSFTFTGKNLLLAYRAVNNPSYGDIEVYVDGTLKKTIKGNTGSWGQSVTELIFADKEAKEHQVEIRMASGQEDKKFTITCMGYTE